MGESTCVYSVLVGKPEGKGLLGRTRIDGRIILRLIVGSGMTGMNWIELA